MPPPPPPPPVDKQTSEQLPSALTWRPVASDLSLPRTSIYWCRCEIGFLHFTAKHACVASAKTNARVTVWTWRDRRRERGSEGPAVK